MSSRRLSSRSNALIMASASRSELLSIMLQGQQHIGARNAQADEADLERLGEEDALLGSRPVDVLLGHRDLRRVAVWDDREEAEQRLDELGRARFRYRQRA